MYMVHFNLFSYNPTIAGSGNKAQNFEAKNENVTQTFCVPEPPSSFYHPCHTTQLSEQMLQLGRYHPDL